MEDPYLSEQLDFLEWLQQLKKQFNAEPDIEEAVTSIFNEFMEDDGVYKRQSVERALALREEITPFLLALLEEIILHPTEHIDRPGSLILDYALQLLGHFREQKAHVLLAHLLRAGPACPGVQPRRGDGCAGVRGSLGRVRSRRDFGIFQRPLYRG